MASPRHSLRSPLGAVRGLGSAKDGTHHWWLQRVSAIALIPLTIWFVASLVVLGTSAAMALGVVGLRFLTDLAVPGWSTTVMTFLISVALQAVMVPVLLAFIVLGNRSSIQVLPIDMAPRFIRDCRALHGHLAQAAE